jgi:hypothetical protein
MSTTERLNVFTFLSFACPKERNKEKDTQKNAALRACLGYPAFLGRHARLSFFCKGLPNGFLAS